jgi:hypothetical protein
VIEEDKSGLLYPVAIFFSSPTLGAIVPYCKVFFFHREALIQDLVGEPRSQSSWPIVPIEIVTKSVTEIGTETVRAESVIPCGTDRSESLPG